MVEIVGRDQELDFLEAFLDRPDAAALVLEGESGHQVGLWRAAVSSARERGLRVLEARPAETERGFAYSGLTDLLEPALDDVLPELAPPRRHALSRARARGGASGARRPAHARGRCPAVRSRCLRHGVRAPRDRRRCSSSTPRRLRRSRSRCGGSTSQCCSLVARARRQTRDRGRRAPACVAAQRRRGPKRLVRATLGTTFARPTLLRVHEASGATRSTRSSWRALVAREGVGDPDAAAAGPRHARRARARAARRGFPKGDARRARPRGGARPRVAGAAPRRRRPRRRSRRRARSASSR